VLVLGGDCTITLGVLAGLHRVESYTGLVNFDGDADLGTPGGDGSGILDAMGIAHLLGLAETELTDLFESRPPLAVRSLAMLGYDETDPSSYHRRVFDSRPDLTHYPDHAVRSDPLGCARGALGALREAKRLIIHFDVDAVDSGDLPLGNFLHYGTGVPAPRRHHHGLRPQRPGPRQPPAAHHPDGIASRPRLFRATLL